MDDQNARKLARHWFEALRHALEDTRSFVNKERTVVAAPQKYEGGAHQYDSLNRHVHTYSQIDINSFVSNNMARNYAQEKHEDRPLLESIFEVLDEDDAENYDATVQARMIKCDKGISGLSAQPTMLAARILAVHAEKKISDETLSLCVTMIEKLISQTPLVRGVVFAPTLATRSLPAPETNSVIHAFARLLECRVNIITEPWFTIC